jgi:hypothetical protein
MGMKWMACVAVLVSTPAFAQSSTGTFSMDRTSVTSVREYVAADGIPTQISLPPNLIVSSMYRPLVEAMLHRSPTFRRQCVRIGGEPRLTVHLSVGALPRRSEVRAMTSVTRQSGGRVTAVIDIFRLDDDIELIAHEVEHVIEQLDEVDLASQAALPRTGVYARFGNSQGFETTRATRVGLKVAGEVRSSVAGR